MIDLANSSVLESFVALRRVLNLRWVDGLKEVGLGTKQAMVLRHLGKNKMATQADLSRATLTDPAAINRALDALDKKGWVKRVDDPKDRRCWNVRLTDAGRGVAEKVDRVYRNVADATFSVLSPADKEAFHSILQRLAASDTTRKESAS